MSQARCPLCKRVTAAIRDAAGKLVLLPHSIDGKPVKWPDVCGEEAVSVSLVHDMVRSGRLSPADGALLLELRRFMAWKRQPWWVRLLIAVTR